MTNNEGVSFNDFFKVLKSYREKFYNDIPEESHYLIVFRKIGHLQVQEKEGFVKDILLFLNQWKCHIYPGDHFKILLREWIDKNIESLNDFSCYSIFDIDENKAPAIDLLYSSLMDFKENGIPTMGDAASSKILHLMIPRLFVMWDKNIKRLYNYDFYSEYMIKMHNFARNIELDFLDLYQNEDIENYLMRSLEYRIKKPFSKYIDEYNWYKEVGEKR